MDIDEAGRTSLIVRLVYNRRRYNTRSAGERKSYASFYKLSNRVRSRRTTIPSSGFDLSRRVGLSRRRRFSTYSSQSTDTTEVDSSINGGSASEITESDISSLQGVRSIRSAHAKPIVLSDRIDGHDAVSTVEEGLLADLQDLITQPELFTSFIWGDRSLLHQNGVRLCYVDLATKQEISVAAWRYGTPKAVIIASLPMDLIPTRQSHARSQVVLRSPKHRKAYRVADFLRPGWIGYKWETFLPTSTETRTILKVVTDVPYRKHDSIADLASLLRQSRDAYPSVLVGSDIAVNAETAEEVAPWALKTVQVNSSERRVRQQQRAGQSSHNVGELARAMKRARRSKMAQAASISSDSETEPRRKRSSAPSVRSMRDTPGATRELVVDQTARPSHKQELSSSPQPSEFSVTTAKTITTFSTPTAELSATAAVSESTSTATPPPASIVKIMFKNHHDELVDEELFSECNDARSFFDRAIVADIATRGTTLLQVSIGEATGCIRRDHEGDFEKKVLGKLAVRARDGTAGSKGDVMVVIVRHYR